MCAAAHNTKKIKYESTTARPDYQKGNVVSIQLPFPSGVVWSSFLPSCRIARYLT